jgi:hypothetical protein
MKVADRHRAAAHALVIYGRDWPKTATEVGFLAAVEQIEEQGLTFVWKDEDEDRGLAWVEFGSVYLDLSPDDIDGPLHSLRASDARRIAYALLVLADEADAFAPRAHQDGPDG